MPSKDIIVEDLHKLYEIPGLPLDPTETSSGFTVLKDGLKRH